MPEFLYQIRPVRLAMLTEGPTERETAHVQEHFAYLTDLYERGIARLVGRTLTTGPDAVGIMVFFAVDEQAAQAVAAADPAIQAGVFQPSVQPFKTLFPPAEARS